MENTKLLWKIIKIAIILLVVTLIIYLAIKSGDIVQGFRDGLKIN